MLEAVSALLHLSITVIWAPFPKIIIRWVAALCLECQLGSDVPKSINYAAQNMKSFNREADVTSLFRVFLPLQTWQSRLSLWSSAKMRRNCQRKLLTSCVPCDKVSQTLTGTMSVDSHRAEEESAWGVSQQLQCSYERYRARWKYAEQRLRGRHYVQKASNLSDPCTKIIAECNCWSCTRRTIQFHTVASLNLSPSLSLSFCQSSAHKQCCTVVVVHIQQLLLWNPKRERQLPGLISIQ